MTKYTLGQPFCDSYNRCHTLVNEVIDGLQVTHSAWSHTSDNRHVLVRAISEQVALTFHVIDDNRVPVSNLPKSATEKIKMRISAALFFATDDIIHSSATPSTASELIKQPKPAAESRTLVKRVYRNIVHATEHLAGKNKAESVHESSSENLIDSKLTAALANNPRKIHHLMTWNNREGDVIEPSVDEEIYHQVMLYRIAEETSNRLKDRGIMLSPPDTDSFKSRVGSLIVYLNKPGHFLPEQKDAALEVISQTVGVNKALLDNENMVIPQSLLMRAINHSYEKIPHQAERFELFLTHIRDKLPKDNPLKIYKTPRFYIEKIFDSLAAKTAADNIRFKEEDIIQVETFHLHPDLVIPIEKWEHGERTELYADDIQRRQAEKINNDTYQYHKARHDREKIHRYGRQSELENADPTQQTYVTNLITQQLKTYSPPPLPKIHHRNPSAPQPVPPRTAHHRRIISEPATSSSLFTQQMPRSSSSSSNSLSSAILPVTPPPLPKTKPSGFIERYHMSGHIER